MAITAVLHAQTTLPQLWLAEQLRMRSPANVSQQGNLQCLRTAAPGGTGPWCAVEVSNL